MAAAKSGVRVTLPPGQGVRPVRVNLGGGGATERDACVLLNPNTVSRPAAGPPLSWNPVSRAGDRLYCRINFPTDPVPEIPHRFRLRGLTAPEQGGQQAQRPRNPSEHHPSSARGTYGGW